MLARILVGVLLLSSVARAADTLDAVKVHTEAGKAGYAAGKYAEALAEYKKAYELAPLHDLLYEMGRCQEKLGDTAAAISTYDQFLAVAMPSPDRTEIEKHVLQLRRSLLELPPQAVGTPEGSPMGGQAPSDGAAKPSMMKWVVVALVALVAIGIGVGIGVGLAESSPRAMLDFPALSATP